MPEWPRWRSGWARGSHPLKSPMTETASAPGAQTANAVPAGPSCRTMCAPSRSYDRQCLPSPSRCRSRSLSNDIVDGLPVRPGARASHAAADAGPGLLHIIVKIFFGFDLTPDPEDVRRAGEGVELDEV